MASPPPRQHRRRTAVVFAGALAAHLVVFEAVGTQVFRPRFDLAAYETPATPLALAPPPKPPAKSKPAPPKAAARPGQSRPLRARLSPALAPAPIEIARADAPGPADGDAQLAAPLAPPGGPGAAGAPPEAPPPDLTAEPPPAHYPIQPGYWRVVEHWPLINRTELYCVEPWNITRFMLAPCNHIYTCVYPVQQLGPDSFRFKGVITARGDRFDVRGGGAYTPTSLHLSVSGLGHWKIVPVIFAASLDGQYLAPDCPADAKRIRQR